VIFRLQCLVDGKSAQTPEGDEQRQGVADVATVAVAAGAAPSSAVLTAAHSGQQPQAAGASTGSQSTVGGLLATATSATTATDKTPEEAVQSREARQPRVEGQLRVDPQLGLAFDAPATRRTGTAAVMCAPAARPQPGPWDWHIPPPARAKKRTQPYPSAPPDLGKVPAIRDAHGFTVVNCFGEHAEANARLIVAAVNAYLAAKVPAC
jgi:hypothetical protein